MDEAAPSLLLLEAAVVAAAPPNPVTGTEVRAVEEAVEVWDMVARTDELGPGGC